ncbi:MAG TPA: aldolase/citrate lyase family protein [Dongiaceae bacterium]|nr:aldolase/citrate lyase family protein [Dongiaceae bacterium]
MTFRQRLENGERLLGAWLNSGSMKCAEAMALAGYDCLLIDQEHGAIDYAQLYSVLMAIERYRVLPMVRVPALDGDPIKRLLDLGIDTLMFPGVRSAGEAAAMVQACLYPPRGSRGLAAGSARATQYGKSTQEYLRDFESHLMVIMQIETAEALQQVDEIAALEHIQALFIGPNDLSAALGHFGNVDHPDMHAAYAKIEETARRHQKVMGTIPTPSRSARHLFEHGYQLVLSGADLSILRTAAAQRISQERPPQK